MTGTGRHENLATHFLRRRRLAVGARHQAMTKEKLCPVKSGAPALDSLAACLIEELGPESAALSPLPGTLDPDSFARLYRESITRLLERIHRQGSHAPMQLRDIELLCRCLLSCANLEQALHCATEFYQMIYPHGGILTLHRRGATALWINDSRRHRPNAATCLVDITGLLFYIQLISWMIGEPLRPYAVAIGYPAMKNLMPFLGLFGARVYTGASNNRIEFDAQLLQRPLVCEPGDLPRFIGAFPYTVIGPVPGASVLSGQVRACMDAALARAQPLPSPAALADLLDMSESTLRRHLRAEGISYNHLRETCLRETAQRYLLDTNWDLEQIAGRLGFSEHSAFRRWTGYTPSLFRHGEVPQI